VLSSVLYRFGGKIVLLTIVTKEGYCLENKHR
jgi:hypothetical protein